MCDMVLSLERDGDECNQGLTETEERLLCESDLHLLMMQLNKVIDNEQAIDRFEPNTGERC